MFLKQHFNHTIKFEGQVYSLSRLGLQPGLSSSTSVFTVHSSFPSDFRDNLWVRLGIGVLIGFCLHFWTGIKLVLIQEHVLLSKIIYIYYVTINIVTMVEQAETRDNVDIKSLTGDNDQGWAIIKNLWELLGYWKYTTAGNIYCAVCKWFLDILL